MGTTTETPGAEVTTPADAPKPAVESEQPVRVEQVPALYQYTLTLRTLTELDKVYGELGEFAPDTAEWKNCKDRILALRTDISNRRAALINALSSMMMAVNQKKGPAAADLEATTIVRRCSRELWLGLELILIDTLFA